MCQRVAGLRNSGVYYFRPDFEHVLEGVVLEYVPKGVYLWDFRFPLFDFAGPNLLYSNRFLDRPFIEDGEMSEELIVDLVMASPEALNAFGTNASMSLAEFAKYLEKSDCLMNPHAVLVYAAALVLLDQSEHAAEMLGEIRPSLHPSDVTDSGRLASSIKKGVEVAREFLDEIRLKNMRTLGLV